MDITTGEETLTRRERERAAHRQDIMEAAIRVFARRGFGAATLDEVAQEAEFSKGALYLYFSSKEDILFNILYSLSLTRTQGFREELSGKGSLRDELRGLFLATAEFTFNHSDKVKVIMAQHVAGLTALSEESRNKLMDLHEEMIGIVRERIQKAREDGELRELPVEAIVSMIHGSLDGMASKRWHLGSMEQVKSAVDVFLDILFKGIEKEKENCE